MLSRRELITAGVAGSLIAEPGGGLSAASEQQADRDGQIRIASAVTSVERVLRDAHTSSLLTSGVVAKIRALMEQFLRANAKFPDFFDIGSGVFLDLYDWHVKHQQQLVVTRLQDGRYTMQFMFSTMILRVEQDPGYVGYPYDKA